MIKYPLFFKNLFYIGFVLYFDFSSSFCNLTPLKEYFIVRKESNEDLFASDFPPTLEWFNTNRSISLNDLKGKVVILNFWTSTCINCIQVFQELEKLEKKWNRELVIISIHSPKFTAEKNSENLRQAILKNEIIHAVANDRDYKIWKSFGIGSWPSYILIDPEGRVTGKYWGEDIFPVFDSIISELVIEFEHKHLINHNPVTFLKKDIYTSVETNLSFPGKVAFGRYSNELFISDTNHNRILKVDIFSGKILDQIGSGIKGKQDGDFLLAQFYHPGGIFVKEDFIYVADTKNHLIRKIDLKLKKVSTMAGNGFQAKSFNVAGIGANISLNFPWDLIEYENILYITMAGAHQIWKVDLETMDTDVYAGSGRENLFDGKLMDSSLSQPGGIIRLGNTLIFNDSDSSSIRLAEIGNEGKIQTLIGKGLFEFGDIDGMYPHARLQFPSGISIYRDKIYIADTLNNKIKILDLNSKEVKKYIGTGNSGMKDGYGLDSSFNNPSGIAFLDDKMYIADTNNHLIRIFDMKTKKLSTLNVTLDEDKSNKEDLFENGSNFETFILPEINISPKTNFINLKLVLPKGFLWKNNSPFYFSKKSGNEKVIHFIPEKHEDILSPKFPISFPVKIGQGKTEVTISSIIYFYEEKKENLNLFKKFQLKFNVNCILKGEVNPVVEKVFFQ